MATPTFVETDEQQLLRSTVRKLAESRGDSESVRAVISESGVDAAAWKDLAQMGLVGLLVPEEHGGAGSTLHEACIVVEELGRALVPVPYLSSAILAPTAILAGGSEQQRADLLPALASGERRATLAHLDAGGRLDAAPGVTARAEGDELVLDGTAGYVLDGAGADDLVVAVVLDTGALELVVVPADAPGLTRTPVEALDLTRPMATLELADVRAPASARLAGGDGVVALHRALAAGIVAVANEQVGGARAILEATLGYARTRMQFGRAIGSFQAIKHRLADLTVEVEAATSAAYHAARVTAAGDVEETAIAAPTAKSYASEVYEHVAGESIQIHGGIGFTWEHDAHLYFKRAKASKLLLGDPRHHRRILGEVLGL